jgi:hypothetical protein
MGKSKKRKTKIKHKEQGQGHAFADSYLENTTEDFKISDENYKADCDYAKSFKEEDQASHEIEGYKTHTINHNQYFNDDLGIDQDDYEVEQERYVVESEDTQPIAVDRYFKRFGKSRRTPR